MSHNQNLVHRNVSGASKQDQNNNYLDTNQRADPQRERGWGTQSEEEMEPLPSVPSGETIPQDSGTIEVLDSSLKKLNPKLRNWIVRGIFGMIMIFGFSFVVYLGPFAITILILAIQVKCFHEIITIGYVVYKSHHLPWFRTITWYFLITSNYYLYGESLIEKFSLLLKRDDFLAPFVQYHRFISFSLYTAGFVGFVLTLKKTYYLKQFTLFGYTNIALMLIVTQSNLMIYNVFDGIIWFLVPVAVIICNDIMAYMFGFFFGRTKLIKLSPKKTWEGFIGGFFGTVVFAYVFSHILCQYKEFVCPLEYDEATETLSSDNCDVLDMFKLHEYTLFTGFTVKMYPFQKHALAMAIFASTIGPFGGFFASGFKRAFKIKDFGDTIPGHGGFMDRFDCQVIMATFVNTYIQSFIHSPSPHKLFNQLLVISKEDQIEFLRLLNNHFGNVTSVPR